MATLNMGLALRDLTFSYEGNAPVFQGLNRHYENSKSYLWSAPSGRGKSTLAKLICGYLSPSEGSIELDGVPIAGRPGHYCQYVDQEEDLFPWLPVKKQLQIPFDHWDQRLEDQMHSLLIKFELPNILELYPYQLSTGMRKRLSLVRSLLVDPRVLILDETLSAIEEQSRYCLIEELIDWKERSKAILIVISHHQREFMDKFDCWEDLTC